jgi:hypothetical protein
MKCNKCGKWAGAHATLPGQPTDHLCMCTAKPVMGIPATPADGLEVVAWLSKHGHMQGNHENLSKRHYTEYCDHPDWKSLVTLSSAQAAVEAERERTREAEKCEDAYAKRITDLESALRQAREALQHAAKDSFRHRLNQQKVYGEVEICDALAAIDVVMGVK